MADRPLDLSPGDVLWARPDPASIGREQRGRRPVLVVGNELYLATVTTLTLVVPLTTVDRGWDNHVSVGLTGLPSPSFAMTEQVRVIARERLTERLGSVDPVELQLVREWLVDYLV